MAEAFAIVGLASSIVAFVDFSLKVIAAAKSVRDSGYETLPKAHEIGVVLEDVRLSKLRAIQAAVQGGSLSAAERHIMTMTTECERLEHELRGVVEKLKINGDSRFKTIQSTRLALRIYRKEKDIEDLHGCILRLDTRIRSNVQMILDRRNRSETLSKLSALKISQEELGIRYNSKLDTIQENILQLVESEQVREGELAVLKEHLDSLARESAVCRKQYRVIKSLYFPELSRRWSEITNADKSTNDWIFDLTKTNFLAWLKEGKGIYWISGKAGSGKSTLLKFAANHDQTVTALKEWAGSAQLHTASFYFWNQGFEMQKSHIGLFQSLLYQILRQAPELAPLIHSNNRLDHERWEFSDLKRAFESIATQSGLSTKYCFFIDGLDEYNGNEEAVLSFLSYFSDSKLADIKICVSSRPRALFKPLEQSVDSLTVQHFTEEDMRTHVRAGLQMNGKFNNLPKDGCEEIIADISQQSQGVWLWVDLVTRELVHAVNRDEGLDTLKKIVRQFPPDLEAYFEHIIKCIRPVHRVEMAQIFLITTEQRDPLPIFFFSLLNRENRSPDYAVNAPMRPLGYEEWDEIEEQWRARLQNRCSDLLVVRHLSSRSIFVLQNPVDFIHRTVPDFLQGCYYSQLKQVVAPLPGFDPLVSLCRMTLFALKSLPDIERPAGFRVLILPVLYLMDNLLYYAHEIDKRSADPDTAHSLVADVLDELEQVIIKQTSAFLDYETRTYGGDPPPGEDDYREYLEGGKSAFLALAIRARLVRYVRPKLAADPRLIQNDGRPLLDYALRPRRCGWHNELYPMDDPSVDINILRLLLEYKANPNHKVHCHDGQTVWALFLQSCYQYEVRGEATAALRKSWYQACVLLCRHGADPRVQLDETGALDTAESVLEKLFGSDQTRQLQVLMAEYQEQKKGASRGSWLLTLDIRRWL